MAEQSSKLTRRAFLAATTTTAALTVAGCKTNSAQVTPKKRSPNELVNCAGIGVGGKGLSDIMNCRKENVVALCDVDQRRAEEAYYRLPDAKRYTDYRKMLEEMGDRIDAVTISTPDHTHAPAAYMAMEMGIHVYVQKPLTHTVAEARLLSETARKNNVVSQMGNQGHSGNGVRELCEIIWDGAIGDVREAHIWTDRPSGRWPQGVGEPLPKQPVPAELDWNLWLGAAPVRDFNTGYVPHKWRGWWDFGCGALGDMACHIMDPAFWALRLGDAKTFSCEIVSMEDWNTQTPPARSVIKYSFPARAAMPPVAVYWYNDGVRPPRPEGVPEGEELGDGKNGSYFVGSEGVATSGEYGGNSRLLPDARMAEYTLPEPTVDRVPGQNHYRDWLDAIKGLKQAACSDFSYAGPFTEMVLVGALALKSGETVEYDVARGQVTNNPKANAMLTKAYRQGFELPC